MPPPRTITDEGRRALWRAGLEIEGLIQRIDLEEGMVSLYGVPANPDERNRWGEQIRFLRDESRRARRVAQHALQARYK